MFGDAAQQPDLQLALQLRLFAGRIIERLHQPADDLLESDILAQQVRLEARRFELRSQQRQVQLGAWPRVNHQRKLADDRIPRQPLAQDAEIVRQGVGIVGQAAGGDKQRLGHGRAQRDLLRLRPEALLDLVARRVHQAAGHVRSHAAQEVAGRPKQNGLEGSGRVLSQVRSMCYLYVWSSGSANPCLTMIRRSLSRSRRAFSVQT